MRLDKLVNEYIDLNVFNRYTKYTLSNAMKLFIQRSSAVTLNKITKQRLSEFKNKTLEIAKPVTYNGYLKHLRVVGEYAVEQEYWETNLFKLCKLAPIGTPPKKALKQDDLKRAIKYISLNGDRCNPSWFWINVIKVLYSTGIRRRQLVGIVKSDVDFQKSTLRLGYEHSKTLREWTIPLSEMAQDGLQETISETEKRLGRKLRENEKVFNIHIFNHRYATVNGGMKPESITGFFRRLSRNLKYEFRIGAHRLRHTAATEWCNPEDENPDLFAVQEILGHTNLQTTRGYVQTSMKRLIKVTKSRNSLKF